MRRPLLTALLLVFGLWILTLPGSPRLLADEGVHVVQAGDTLSEIARQYGTDMATLRRLNGLDNADFIWTGQRLRLPELVEYRPEQETTAVATGNYTVQSGDDLLAIANAHGVGLAQLLDLNPISPSQRLAAGQILKVPALPTTLDRASIPAAPPRQPSEPVAETSVEEQPTAVAAAISATEPAEGATETEELVVHVVQAGEHLGTIAAQYGTIPQAIIRANNLADPSLLVPGQRLTVAPPTPGERAAMSTEPGADGYHVHTEFPTTTEKWIDVDLSEQRVVAYEGTMPVKSFIVSTGLPGTPTVTGTFRIWAKTPLQDMSGGNLAAGDYYYLRDVPWVQYFHKDYAFHGTYWHSNYGRPMSRGCINMTNEDAKWLYEWASPSVEGPGWFFSDEENPGTLVLVHP
jgi:LysM repeat protein